MLRQRSDTAWSYRGGVPRIAASTPFVDRDLVAEATWTFSRLLESTGTEGILDLAEPGRRGRGPFRPLFAGMEGIVDLTELFGDSVPARSIGSSRLRVVSQVHGVKPGRGNTTRSAPS
jgi:hypothetical protein